ncbi:DUF2247 family protein [Bacillus pseudomycoides]|uniref:DUF2247 family protein n=1 Tax=Bacillus pseudomycoides TaxID=64104 RepID=UPI000BEE1584|nr:DUF2247 family protein [Bacillus pseudomycoides]PEE37697.1 hypothetical protein COO02_23515 [Bacillus pseudomycoides]PEI90844.1 hypothetical protein CN679_16100 [Bacillus pseudomycoides]PGA81770.1 hypothetical protein COL91_27195 [Bacillus pseudomycoides]PHF35706.1 hypothetical protein COF72_25185 [Bacillus pseudomycoides]
MDLIDFKNKGLKYDWKTIYTGVNKKYFEPNVISDYAVELMEAGDDDAFVNELAWGIDSNDLDKILFEIKDSYFPNLEENSEELQNENRKLRFLYLSKLKEKITDEDELLNRIAEFYDRHDYPEDMTSFITYMPQDTPTTKKDLLNRFYKFLDSEKKFID